MKIKVKSPSLKAYIRHLKRFESRFKQELLHATEIIGKLLLESTRQRFIEQGPGWPGLSAEYAKWKAESGFDPRILFRTFRLFSAIRFQRKSFISGEINVAPGRYTGIKKYASYSKRKSFKRFSGFKLRAERKSFREVAEIHESGSRPFFAPTALLEGLRVKLLYRRAFRNAFK